MTRNLEGKRALVTGAASGIGKAIATAMAAAGARVCLADIAPESVTGEVVAMIAAAGDEAFAARADVADEASVTALLATAVARLGGLDILVNNAGVMSDQPLLETSMEHFDKVVGVNLRGVFLVGREAIRAMVAQGTGGQVINIASELAYLGRAQGSVYCASKGGVVSLTRSWAREFAPAILVNAIAPGPIDTPMLHRGATPQKLALEADLPLQRIGRPEEIASTAVFLAGPGATYFTGQCLSPNGGAVMF